ncbi:MAG: leucine--tRNA ligase [Flammeovirgaceae bacterium TMED32]|nr:MAG: leucine--tRNA ligase [Flammeovirgaceae bacterium TMED32]
MADYNFKEVERKWQKYWNENSVFKVAIDIEKPKYYCLDMFPYPSGAGLHVGHPLGYIATDIISRYKKLKGFNVLHPMGFDSFGLPAEQYAIQTGQHPSITTHNNIIRYKEQLKSLGFSYDWSRELRTSDPSFYRWTQWIFKLLYNSWYNVANDQAESIDTLTAQFLKNGNIGVALVGDQKIDSFSSKDWKHFSFEEKETVLTKYRLTYLAETTVNWCAELGTVLSNDEVKDGYSERGGHSVVKKNMPQWNMRISAYADRLLTGLNKIDWPDAIKDMQRNWIGKSIGAEINFNLEHSKDFIKVFTTRVDTIFGVTFLVVAPESDLTLRLTTSDQSHAVTSYVEATKAKSERDRISNVKQVSGVFTGSYVLHPFTGQKVPVWIADYVLSGYGTGAVMAVPSGDQRDFDFAKKYKLPINQIIDAQIITETEADPTKDGKMINSDFLNGLNPKDAMLKGIEALEKIAMGTAKVNYRIRDAIFGRQRYWGEPIPVKYKNNHPELLEEAALPLVLPEVDKYLPTADGAPPLGRAKDWYDEYQNPYELTTMPGWAGSSWYFFRYMDPHNDKDFASTKALDYWESVDLYVGGPEHATGHLLYSRFWTKFLYDRGYIKVDEYAKKLINQGMIQGRSNFVYRVKNENIYVSEGLKNQYDTYPLNVDVNIVKDDILDIEGFKSFISDAKNAKFILEDGKYICGWEVEKMSKSKFNVVNPDILIEKYGADTLRMYEMFLGPIEHSKPWNTNGIEGVFKFVRKFWNLFHNDDDLFEVSEAQPSKEEFKILHQLIKKIEDDIEQFSLNTSISNFMIATNELVQLKCNKRQILEPITILIAPYAPHLSEEIWKKLDGKHSIFNTTFPLFDASYLIEDSFEYPISVNGKMRAKLSFPLNVPVIEMEQAVLNHTIIKKWLDGKSPKKIIIVPKKIVNIVI